MKDTDDGGYEIKLAGAGIGGRLVVDVDAAELPAAIDFQDGTNVRGIDLDEDGDADAFRFAGEGVPGQKVIASLFDIDVLRGDNKHNQDIIDLLMTNVDEIIAAKIADGTLDGVGAAQTSVSPEDYESRELLGKDGVELFAGLFGGLVDGA